MYFGHQSVGADVLEGIESWSRDLQLGLRIVQARGPAAVEGPALVHFLAGENGDFASKNSSMLRFLDARSEPDGAIALLKYCYVDIGATTDVDGLFEEYRDTIASIGLDHPDVTIVHATIPLAMVRADWRAGMKRFLGRDKSRQLAASRHRYNTLLRAEFGGREPIFDIARIESTRWDGTRALFNDRGIEVETLAPENTTDGGHLNQYGKQAAAAELLDVLSDLTGDVA